MNVLETRSELCRLELEERAKLRELATQVALVRELQVEYFAKRAQSTLIKSKEEEKRLDRLIVDVETLQARQRQMAEALATLGVDI